MQKVSAASGTLGTLMNHRGFRAAVGAGSGTEVELQLLRPRGRLRARDEEAEAELRRQAEEAGTSLPTDDVPEYTGESDPEVKLSTWQKVLAAVRAGAAGGTDERAVQAAVIAFFFALMASIWTGVLFIMSGGGTIYPFLPASTAYPLNGFAAIIMLPVLLHGPFEALKLVLPADGWFAYALVAVAGVCAATSGVTLTLAVQRFIGVVVEGTIPATATEAVGVYAALFCVGLATIFEACLAVFYVGTVVMALVRTLRCRCGCCRPSPP